MLARATRPAAFSVSAFRCQRTLHSSAAAMAADTHAAAPAVDHKYAALFASQADLYARFRPTYPVALFDTVYAYAAEQGNTERRTAVDIATGSGQAAVELAKAFDTVIGVDASPEQVKQAPPRANMRLQLGTAESTGLPPACADLVTVAQALHWFRVAEFYAEAARLLRPGGTLAIWGYDNCTLDPPAADALISRVYGHAD
jgi:ubiquinone/menaquinone biosynthesis C-methylase UbiE